MFGYQSTQSASLGQINQNSHSQPWVDQNQPKKISCFYIKSKIIEDFCKLWPTLIKFDSILTLKSARKPYFDPTVKMGWNYSYCEEYWIPMTVHGLKLELKWLRYLETRARLVSSLLETIIFYSTFWILILSSVLDTRHPCLSRDIMISLIGV